MRRGNAGGGVALQAAGIRVCHLRRAPAMAYGSARAVVYFRNGGLQERRRPTIGLPSHSDLALTFFFSFGAIQTRKKNGTEI